jgi:PAS domain S-box-containing protein
MSAQVPVSVLHVDDDEANRETLAWVLRAEGFTVKEAATGREALRLAAEQPDVIILDIRLPDLDGHEVCRRIRGDPATAAIPVLELSGHFVTRQDEVRALEGGADAYLVKPVDPPVLIAHVRALARTRRAEAALRQRERQLQSLFEGALDALVIVDDHGRYVDANPAACALFGLPRARLLGRPVADFAAPGTDAERLWQRFRAQGQLAGDFRLRRPDGTTRDVEYRATANFLPGRHLAILRDVSERKRLEEQLRQAQKMEAIGRLAGGIAHDFNNLLTVINGYSEVLLDRLGPDDPSAELIGEVRNAGERAASLTRQLLAFSRNQVLAPRLLDLNALVAGMEKMLARLIGADVEMTFVPGPAPGMVRADPGQLEQVLLNLVVNARDAMPRGGQLTVETGNVALDEAGARRRPGLRPGPYVLLAVSDTGHGMDEATRALIFEPFFTTKGPGQGTGLGLAMVYAAVQQSDGHIDVYSEPGHGSTFKIYLPRAAGEAPDAQAAEELKILGGTETILLVEDEDGVRTLAAVVLRASGYTVLEAKNGLEAVELCLTHAGPIDLLLTDVVMPRMSGRQLADALAEPRPGLRAVFMSGYTDDAVVRHGILGEGISFLNKPFTPAALARKVREALDAGSQGKS